MVVLIVKRQAAQTFRPELRFLTFAVDHLFRLRPAFGVGVHLAFDLRNAGFDGSDDRAIFGCGVVEQAVVQGRACFRNRFGGVITGLRGLFRLFGGRGFLLIGLDGVGLFFSLVQRLVIGVGEFLAGLGVVAVLDRLLVFVIDVLS